MKKSGFGMPRLPIWVVYDHPKDLPDYFVARRFEGEQPTASIIMSTDLDVVRGHMREMGLVCLHAHPKDDPVILETWL